MKQKTYITIPQPCHENWNAMTPHDKGRFCESCAKTVVDFSIMSDAQVLNYLSQSHSRLCGRFAPEQLERPLQPVQAQKKMWWMAALMPVMLLVTKANAQKKIVKSKDATASECTIVMGKMMIPKIPKSIDSVALLTTTIHGKIVNESGEPIPFTSIFFKDNLSGSVSNEQGEFSLNIKNAKPEMKLIISNVSYEQKEIFIDLKDTMQIVLQEKQAILPEISVSSSDSYLSDRLGGAVSVITVIHKDTLVNKIRKVFHAATFTIYPNPAQRGSSVRIDVKKTGNYSIQLLNANSKLITNAVFDAANGATITSLHIPSSSSAGIYFIRLINDDTKKQYTEKIIIE